MANIIINKTAFLDAPITVDSLHGMTFTNESGAHQFVISAMQGGNPLALTGSVSARFMRANNTTILLTGSVTNGKAVITLHQDCYNVPGRFQLAIFNTVSGTTTCIYAAIGTVQRTVAGDLIDSGEAVPDISDLLAQIDACEQATAAANAAATKAIRYDTAQTLTDTQKAQARTNIDGASVGDVNDLKSALGHISEKGKNLFPIETKTTAPYGASVEYENGILTFSGTASGSNPDYSYSACTPVTLPAGKYTFSRNAAKGQTILRKVNGTSTTNVAVLQGTTNTTTFTLAEATELYLYIGSLSGSITTTQIKIQLESGETKTDWEEPWESAVDKIARFHKTSLELTWTSGKAFIYNAGWSNNSGWSYADVILTQGESIIVSLNVSTIAYPLSVWSDDGNSIIKVCFPIADSAAYKTLTYTCASDKERVRINVQSANKGNVVAVKYNVGDLLNKSNIEAGKNSIPCYDVLYDSIIAIGDSLTQGSYTGYDIHEQESYPAFLAKMMGVNVTNAGRAGWTTLQWFDGDSQTQKGFPYYDYSDYDTAVICLGTNGGFTDTVDDGATDTTNTGAYCSIIEGMRTQNPNINILLCNLWTSGGTGGAALANTVIGKIALKYGLTVIDLQSEFRTVYGAYHAVRGNIHLGRIGYAKMAQIIRNALEKQVMIDPTNYNYIPS